MIWKQCPTGAASLNGKLMLISIILQQEHKLYIKFIKKFFVLFRF